MSTSTSTKYQVVRNKLEEAIRSGEFATGDQLPAEQTLADQYGVSLMTARRVVCDLVAADLLERRARKGTFVRQHAMERVNTITLNMIVVAYDTSFQRTFLNEGMRMAEQRGWRGNVIRLARGEQDAAVRALQDGELALVMLEELAPQSALGLAVRAARGRVICLGLDATKMGVPSIFVDVRRSFRILFEHLLAQGHRDIVLVMQKLSEEFSEQHRRAWRESTADIYGPLEADEHVIELETPKFQCPSFDAYAEVRQMLAEKSPTALICFGEEITQGTLAACRSAGHSVPDTISVVNILDAPSMVFAHPPITSMDVDFETQVGIAMEVLDAARSGEQPDAKLHCVEPLLLDRGSSAPAVTKRDGALRHEGLDYGRFFSSAMRMNEA